MWSANHVVLIKGREGHTPHSSSKLSKATNKAGPTEDSVGNGNTARTDVVHGEDEGCASEGEETTANPSAISKDHQTRTVYSQRTRVTEDPQLRSGVVNKGMSGEGGSSVAA
jgi:hypothetical protein